MLNSRVYILDYELISPIATGREELIPGIESNFSADKKVERTLTEGIPFKKAAEVTDDLSSLIENESDAIKKICKYDRKLELLAASYGKAEKRIKPLIEKMSEERTGVILGIGADSIQFELFEKEIIELLEHDANPIAELYTEINTNASRLNLTNNPYDLYSAYLAGKFNAGAFQKSILTACVSSTQAIAFASDSIRSGECDVVIAGGTDSLINVVAMISFGKLGVIAESTDDVTCKPFDLNRNGALAGECAGFVIMASERFVKENNLHPKAEFLGYGNTLDAFKITAPDPEGEAITQAIKDAVKNAGLSAGEIDYINAHGTGTKHNDHLELKCIGNALGADAFKIPISSTKDRHGHAIAAAGIQEFCILLELMKNDLAPGNLNLKTPCSVEYNLLRENKKMKIKHALSNNFAFGGINTVLVLKNLEDGFGIDG